MIHAERLRTLYLFTVLVIFCFLITGCPKPDDVDCIDLSKIVLDEPPVICPDGNEPQLCMAPESENCGYYANSQYIPCKSCLDCDAAIDIVVALCEATSPPPVDSSSTD